jgi:hypothetical protein
MPPDDYQWVDSEAARIKISRPEMVRRAVSYARHHMPAVQPEPAGPQTEGQGHTMPRKKTGPPGPRIRRPHVTEAERKDLPAKITCPRCGREQWVGEDGNPRFHLRAARPGDPEYHELVPAMVACD